MGVYCSVTHDVPLFTDLGAWEVPTGALLFGILEARLHGVFVPLQPGLSVYASLHGSGPGLRY